MQKCLWMQAVVCVRSLCGKIWVSVYYSLVRTAFVDTSVCVSKVA